MTTAAVRPGTERVRGSVGGTAADLSAGVIAGALAGVLALAAAGGRAPLGAAVFVVQAVLAAGWLGALRVPARAASLLVAVGAAAAADALLATDAGRIRALPPVLAVTLAVAFAVQALRPAGRPRATASLAGAVSAAALVVLPAVLLAARVGADGRAVCVAALAGAAVAVPVAVATDAVVGRLPGGSARLGRPTGALPEVRVRGCCGAVVGAAVAAGVALPVAGAVGGWAGLVGAVSGGAAAVVHLTARRLPVAVRELPGRRRSAVLLAAVLPLVAAGPVAWVAGRVLA